MATMDGKRSGDDSMFGDHSGDSEMGGNKDQLKPLSSEALSVGSIWMGENAKDQGSTALVVSDMLLLWLWLERRLEAEVQAENFDEAAMLKGEMRKLRVKALDMLEGKIHKAADTMRAETAKKKRDTLARIQMDLDTALAEEDYEKAAQLQTELDAETKKRDCGVSPSKLWKKIDSVWLEGEINSKIQQLRVREEKFLEDKVNKLKNDIKEALEEEDFHKAAEAQAELTLEEHKRDFEKMEKLLARECSFKRLEQDKLKQDQIAFLEDRLAQEIVSEDYESATLTQKDLFSCKIKAVLADVANRTHAAREDQQRLGVVPKLEQELEGAVANEDFKRASEIRDSIFSVDVVRRLQKELTDLVNEQKFDQAAGIKKELMRAYVGSLSPAVLSELGYTYGSPKYRVGDVVEHTELGYRGVIVGWHDRCRATDDWVDKMGVDSVQGGREQRFYHVLPDTRQLPLVGDKDGQYPDECTPAFLVGMNSDDPHPGVKTTYVPECELQKWDFQKPLSTSSFFANMLRSVLPESPVVNPLVAAFFFSYSRGRYLHGGKVRGLVFYHMPRGGEYDFQR